MSKYDEVLRPFVVLMEKELHANSHKGDREGWLQMTEEHALGEIEYHVSKLSSAMANMNPDGIREYAADVANLCMMLLDIGGQLNAAPTPPQPIYDEAKERELLEAWAYSVCHVPYGWLGREYFKRMGDHYEDDYAHGLWQGWLACAQSRAKSVEVGDE